MNRHKPLVACRLTACVLALTATGAWAGNLEPPGPPAPTMKTLSEVEPRVPISSLPFTISQPGSYYLTNNLTGTGLAGILVNSSDVTLDLMGFTLQGSPGSGRGITTEAGVSEIVIRNGFIKGWVDYAVYNPGFVAILGGVTLQDLRIENNGGGVSCGDTCKIVDCVLRGNGGASIQVGANSVVQNCAIDSQLNGAIGIFVVDSFNRIEGNHVITPLGLGISVIKGKNLIVHNSTRGTPSYVIASGNQLGPITNDPATAGPWANFDLNTAP